MITFTRIGAKVKVDYGGGNGVNLDPNFNVVYQAEDPYIYITEATSTKDRSSNGLKIKITDISGRPSDVPEEVADWLRDNFFYKGGLSEYIGEFANYTDLTTTLPAGIAGRFAYVLNSEGTQWLPGSVGGTYYGAGWYYDTGSVWSNKNDEIFEGLQTLSDDKLDKITLDPQTVAGPVEFLQDITVPSGSVVLGKNGARLSSTGRAMLYTDARERKTLFCQYIYDDTGSTIPYYWKFDPEINNLLVAPDFGSIQQSSWDLQFLGALGASSTNAIYVRPISSGTLRVELFEGIDDTGGVLFDFEFDVSIVQINTTIKLELPVNVITEGGDMQYLRLSGVTLDGAVQSSGPFIGTPAPFLEFDVQLIERIDVAPKFYVYADSENFDRSSQTTEGLINPTTIDEEYLRLNFIAPHDGFYEIKGSYEWSYDATNTDFIGKVELRDSSDVLIKTISNQRQEPKDSGGFGVTLDVLSGGVIAPLAANSGTDQRHVNSFCKTFELIGGTEYNLVLDWAASSAGVEATLYNANLIVDLKIA